MSKTLFLTRDNIFEPTTKQAGEGTLLLSLRPTE